MARTTGPLFSFDASGTVAGAVVFSKWRGRNYVRRHAVPGNPRTVQQVSVRVMLSFLSRYWQSILTATQDTWEDPAAAKNYSKFNAYIAANMTAWKHFLHPSQAYPRNPVSTPPDAPTLAAAGGVGLATLTVTENPVAADWGYSIHMSPTPAFEPSKANAVAVEAVPGSPLVVVIAPLAAGTYYFDVLGFNVDGVTGAASGEEVATVT